MKLAVNFFCKTHATEVKIHFIYYIKKCHCNPVNISSSRFLQLFFTVSFCESIIIVLQAVIRMLNNIVTRSFGERNSCQHTRDGQIRARSYRPFRVELEFIPGRCSLYNQTAVKDEAPAPNARPAASHVYYTSCAHYLCRAFLINQRLSREQTASLATPARSPNSN